MFSIKKYTSDYVHKFDKLEFNTSNHWNGYRPIDYDEKIVQTNTKNWVHKFHDDYTVLTLDKEDLKWMFDAFKIGRITGMFPKAFSEDLEMTLKKHKNIYGKFFVRTEKSSMKYGVYGTGPYTSLEYIIESMVTTKNTHRCFNDGDEFCNIYLMRWLVDLDPENEFRIFVHKNQITAISQQNIYSSNNWLKNKSKDFIFSLIIRIRKFFRSNISQKMKYLENYVMDLAIIRDSFYFIEPNSFGREYASGSALFHWIDDEDILLNTKGSIEFRYVCD
jgi:hypothetical protein